MGEFLILLKGTVQSLKLMGENFGGGQIVRKKRGEKLKQPRVVP